MLFINHVQDHVYGLGMGVGVCLCASVCELVLGNNCTVISYETGYNWQIMQIVWVRSIHLKGLCKMTVCMCVCIHVYF